MYSDIPIETGSYPTVPVWLRKSTGNFLIQAMETTHLSTMAWITDRIGTSFENNYRIQLQPLKSLKTSTWWISRCFVESAELIEIQQGIPHLNRKTCQATLQ